ncbi:MAG: 1-acyl-sn-glycerol-3-phosphate acyltransferase [Thermoproteota archaeon]|jgi:1-acyl-sn-glycerol-3-phosphate acyltransferase
MQRIIKIAHLAYAALLISLIFFGALFPAAILCSGMKSFTRKQKILSPLWQLFGYGFLRWCCFSDIYTEDKRSTPFKKVPQKGLFIANHQSLMDIPLLATRFQIPPIMKKEVMRIPFFGLTAKITGAIPVDRKNRNSRAIVLRKCQDRLKAGFAVQYYPEGTRVNDSQPREFDKIKMRLVEFAFEQNIPVVCVSVYGTTKVLNKYGLINAKNKLGLIIEDGIEPSRFKTKDEFCRHCWSLIESNYEMLSNKLA